MVENVLKLVCQRKPPPGLAVITIYSDHPHSFMPVSQAGIYKSWLYPYAHARQLANQPYIDTGLR